jgi:AcrR family transcriptional regulator
VASSGNAESGAGPQVGLRERGKQRRIDRILNAALEILREEPPSALTSERIAERAEVAPMTVFNLVGNREQLWAALIERAMAGLDYESIGAPDPQERARAIVDEVTRVLCSDAPVFRALLAGWSRDVPVAHDPTEQFVRCLRDAAAAGAIAGDLDARRLGELMAASVRGTIHQWTAGLLSDRAFRRRAREMVDLVFAAAKAPPAAQPPGWRSQDVHS